MATASDISDGVRAAARDSAKAAADASGTIQNDLQALRDDLARLAEQISGIVSNRGNAAWQRAKTSVDGMMSDAQVRGQEAVGAVRDISDNFVEAIDESIKNRPYTTLALAVGLGVLLGATWRR